MFNYKEMIKTALEYFPLWSDIKKRHNKSIGGQLVDSVLKETLELDSAIQDYKDFYFLDKYEGKENEVEAFVYAITVGNLETSNIVITYNDKNYPLTLNIDDFYNSEKLSYYEDGLIYIKESVVNDIKTVNVEIDNHKYTYTLEKKHVWNIFDEYAVFVGLERYENETNKQLKDRIIFTTKNPGNSSEDGLKNSIVSELMSLIDIEKEDIEISKVTPENLIQPYKKYKSLLEMLNSINKDCLKDKRWDLDKWSYDFKSIKFMDNIWDDAVEEYQNGIGSNEDLKVIMADSEKTTNADIIMYNKSLLKLDKYVQDKHIKKNISFQLKKYEDILTPVNAKYNIKASEVLDITNEPIELSVFESNIKSENRKVEELYKLGKDIATIDNSKITDNKSYRLEFYPSGLDLLKISKAKVIYKHKITGEITEVKNLLSPAPGFTLNAQGDLVNTSIKKIIKSVNNFNSYSDLMDSEDGVVLGPASNLGKGILNVSGLGLSNINFDIDHKMVQLPQSKIRHNQFCFWRDDELMFRYDINQERRFEIDTEANILSFDITDGEADLFVEIDGNTKYEKIKAPFTWKIDNKNESKKVKVTVISNFNNSVKFSNFKYACNNISFKLKYGNIIKDNTGYRLPNIAINDLIIELSSKTSSTPVLKAVYIGGDLQSLKYKTEIIEHKENNDRIIEISTNGLTDLLTVDTVGSTLYRNKNYTPSITYKALKDNAWIRLNLEEYEKVNTVTCSNANIHLIEESGKIYYNIVMKAGQFVNFVTINGIRNTALKTITLENMVKLYFDKYDSTRDKLYASKLCKGLLLEHNDPDHPDMYVINIKNNIFEGINATKYKFTKLPDNLNVAFNNNNSQINNDETFTPFDSVSFIPAGTKIYEAVNESNMFTGEIRGIKILNNFSPILNTSKLMYYEVHPFETDYEFEVKFSSFAEKNNSFDTLRNWCVGLKEIAIKTPIDLANSKNYKIDVVEIEDEVLLSRYVDLKHSYKLSENNEIFTNKYMVIPEEGKVIYERYSDNQNENLIIQEEVIMEEDGFTKLSYSNIDELLYIGYSSYSGKNEIMISDFELLKDEGIMLWTNRHLIDQAKKVYLRYTIKRPMSILLDEDSLYKAIGYDVEAYDEIDRFSIAGITDGYRFDLRQLDKYKEVDLIYTKCSSPSFKSEGVNDVLIFNKVAQKDTILVRTGYYYINGKEYYLFPSKDEITIENEKIIKMDNVDISGEEITTFKATNNFVRNSEMLFRGINELYNYDASKSDIKGISFMNSLTACDNFNLWNTFGTKMFLKDGLNGVGINFSPEIPNGYAYIDITEFLIPEQENYLSFWADKTLSVYIGEEKKYLDIDFPHSINIKLKNEVVYENDPIRSSVIDAKKDVKYYIVVKGNGTIDDIVLSDKSNLYTSHKKNIDLLNLKIKECSKSGQKYRVFFKDNKNVVNKGALLTSDKSIKIASNIYWGITPLITYENREDFVKCYTSDINIENNYICTGKSEGYIETPPIFLDNPLTIKRLVFKLNEIEFNDMRGMKVQILSSNSRHGDFIPINSFNNNYGFVYGDALLKYIKLRITMPPKKYVNNFGIYVEYCSTEDNYPKLLTPTSGELITKIFDTQYSNDYKIRELDIEEISNINDIDIFVQASRDDFSADVWHDWKKIELTSDYRLKKDIVFYNTRFFKFKILLKTSNASIKINNIDIEVI